jgi:LuxR family maltose regulon positive regulatory protein
MAACAMQVLQESDRSGPQVETTAWAHYLLGIFHYERNNLAQAERYLTPIVSNPYQGHLLCSLNSAAALALIRQAQGQPDQAREIAEMMVSLALETGSEGALSIAKGFEAELALRQGRLAEASQWAEQFDGPLATPQPFFCCRELTLVHILLAQNTPASRRQARQMLSTSYDYYTSIHHTALRIDVLALQAVLYQTERNEPAALDALAQALALAEPGGYIRLFVDLGEPLELLLATLVRRDGPSAYSTKMMAAFTEALSPSDGRRRANDTLASPLTPRELEVLELLEKHYSDSEIAHTLVVSVRTVRSHLEHIGEKLDGHGRQAIVRIAKAQGLL